MITMHIRLPNTTPHSALASRPFSDQSSPRTLSPRRVHRPSSTPTAHHQHRWQVLPLLRTSPISSWTPTFHPPPSHHPARKHLDDPTLIASRISHSAWKLAVEGLSRGHAPLHKITTFHPSLHTRHPSQRHGPIPLVSLPVRPREHHASRPPAARIEIPSPRNPRH